MGKFISFEGPEGAGKSTQIQRLAAHLTGCGQKCLLTKEPGGTPIGQQIRKILLHRDHDGMDPVCEALLYLADRAQHVRQTIRPALEEGVWVITDRYHDSTRAYQGAARGLDPNHLETLFQMATGGLQPDLTVLLDLPVEEGLRRAKTRNNAANLEVAEGRFEAEAIAFHQRVREFFLELAEAAPERFVVIDATQSEDRVSEAVREQLERRWAVNHV